MSAPSWRYLADRLAKHVPARCPTHGIQQQSGCMCCEASADRRSYEAAVRAADDPAPLPGAHDPRSMGNSFHGFWFTCRPCGVSESELVGQRLEALLRQHPRTADSLVEVIVVDERHG